MTYRGTVTNGVVVIEDPKGLPEGASVNVQLVRRRKTRRKKVNGWDELLKLAGTVKGLPSDMARNHDHYIHGLPRR
ncbi:MAG TPA: hypothetical protein VGP72_18880 [Planctomycetota bacterium]|jgi:hypothetical protein